jgi:FkbM family methyltransferase
MTPGGHVATMTYRYGTSDYNTLTATITEDEYDLPKVSGVALDIGAFLGSVGIALALDNPDLRVIMVEPVPDNIELIRINIAQNGLDDRITLIEGAVGTGVVHYGFTGNESARHHAFVGNSSILAVADASQVIKYQPTMLSELLDTFPFVELMKVDIEGGEWDFLDVPETVLIPTIIGEAHAVGKWGGGKIVDLLPYHDVTLFGDPEGTCEFRAIRK